MKKLHIALTFFLVWVVALPVVSQAQQRYRGMTVSAGLSADDVRALGALGANAARYLLGWDSRVDTATIEEYNVWLDSAIATLDAVLPVFAEQNIGVILDVQTPPCGLQEGSSPHYYRLFVDQECQDAFIDVWKKLATHYKDSTTIVYFDLLNEPGQPRKVTASRDWSKLAQVTAEEIRKIDTSHPIVVGPLYGDQSRFKKLKPLKNISNVLYTFHMYYPKNFQAQGIDGYPLGVTYPSKKYTFKRVKNRMRDAVAFQRKNKVKMYVGEFSVIRWAPGAATYLNDLLKYFEKRKWHWTFHAFRESTVWSVEHTSNMADTNATDQITDRKQVLLNYFAKN